MPPKTISSNHELGEAIKNKRIELGLTIEEAASKAGVGTKTWSRYESGSSIRSDKVRSLCKAINWVALPEIDGLSTGNNIDYNKYENDETWSPYLASVFGKYAAISFVIGSTILLDEINGDLSALSELPKDSHIGEVPSSILSVIMPQQFLVRYDYEFIWAMRQTLIKYRTIAPNTSSMIAHSVLDELVLYLVMEESRDLMEDMKFDFDPAYDEDEYFNWSEWAFDIFQDMDIVTFLYADLFTLTPDSPYHFSNWFKQQFLVEM